MRTRIQYDHFDPALTLKENAEKLHCSVSSIKKYLRKNELDNLYDSTFIKWRAVHDYKQKNPSASLKVISSALGYSINTIRKYAAMSEKELDISFRDNNKVSSFDIKNRNAIKSVSNNQTEILQWIIRLYNDGQTFDADLTASKCFFWKQIPRPHHLFDKYPQLEEVLPLSDADSLSNESFNSIIYDLPFIISNKASTSSIKERFTCFYSVEEAYEMNLEMLNRAFRLLKGNGILVVKTMDCEQYWISDFVLEKAKEIGLELLDKFILTASLRLLGKTRQQHRARKYHSYFFVFRKLQNGQL